MKIAANSDRIAQVSFLQTERERFAGRNDVLNIRLCRCADSVEMSLVLFSVSMC